MEKKRSVGVTIFAIIFLFIGVLSLLLIILTPLFLTGIQTNYYHLHTALINRLTELKEKGYEISDKEKLDEYRETINRLENNLENFEQKFLIHKSMTSLMGFTFFFLFFCASLYILSAIAAIRLYPQGRGLIFTTVSLGFIVNFYTFFTIDYMLKSIKIILKDVFYLASCGSYTQIPPQTASYFSLPDFVRIAMIVYLFMYFMFVIFVFYFFTCPKIKEQFRKEKK